MMLKRLMFMLFALLLTVSSALAQAIAPRCRVCGRKLTECPYKGKHAKKQSEGKKPAEKKKPNKKKAPEKKPNHEAEPVESSATTTTSAQPSTATPTYYGYRIMDDGTVDVYRSEGLIKYLNEKTPATSLKLTGNFGYNGLKALRNHSFKTLDLSDVWVTDSYEESNAKDHIHGAGFHLQWVDGIKADTLILPNDITILETAALGYTIKNLYIGKDVKVINFIEADLSNYNLPKDLHESMLENIFVDKENKDFKSIDGVLFNADGSELIMFSPGTKYHEEDRYIYYPPTSLKKIADYAFFNSKVQEVYLNDDAQEIGYSAFAYSKIALLLLGKKTQTINNFAFNHCERLICFVFNHELRKIPADIFENCPKLYLVHFREDILGNLPKDMFKYSYHLTQICIGGYKKQKNKKFYSELASYLAQSHYNCPRPLSIYVGQEQDAKQYKNVLKDKRKFNIHTMKKTYHILIDKAFIMHNIRY